MGFDNRLLFQIHNSFFMVFAGLEAVFLVLCYAILFSAEPRSIELNRREGKRMTRIRSFSLADF